MTFKSEQQCSAALERTKDSHPIVVHPAKQSALFQATEGLLCCILVYAKKNYNILFAIVFGGALEKLCVSSNLSDQPLKQHNLISLPCSLFGWVRFQEGFVKTDQTRQMVRLIRVVDGHTSKLLKFRTPENLAVIHLKLKIKRPNLRVFLQKDSNGIANGEDPDQSDLGLHCLRRPT